MLEGLPFNGLFLLDPVVEILWSFRSIKMLELCFHCQCCNSHFFTFISITPPFPLGSTSSSSLKTEAKYSHTFLVILTTKQSQHFFLVLLSFIWQNNFCYSCQFWFFNSRIRLGCLILRFLQEFWKILGINYTFLLPSYVYLS